MPNIKRRLLSLNFAILMLLTVIFPAGAVGISSSPADGTHQYKQYIIIDGKEYDATEDQSGDGWRSYYYDGANSVEISLRNYQGGSIISNTNLHIGLSGTNVIDGTSYGIYTTAELDFGINTSKGIIGHLTVSGADGYSAIYAEKTVHIRGELTAIGGNAPAISSNEDIQIKPYWPAKTLVGDTESEAQEGVYSDQTYVSFERIPYQMTLHGNGGVDATNQTEKQIVYTTGTAGYLFLYPYFKTFSNGEKQLIGWSDSADNVDKIHAVDEEYQYANNTYSADLYAVWEDTVHKAVVLKNYYGEYTQTGHHFGDTLPIPIEKGMTYTLPDQTCSGCRFDGWLAEDGTTLYPAGTVITVDETISFTAQFTPLTLKIDGQEYDASQSYNKKAQGWYYSPRQSRATLEIYQSYSGSEIEVPTSVEIRLYKSLTINTAHSPIIVHGDAIIHISNYGKTDNPVIVSGENAPAIIADGNVTISVSDNDDQRIKFIVKSGNPNVPAIQAKHIKTYSKMLYAGTNAENISTVGKYSGEAYAEFIYASYYRITLPSKSTVPSAPQYDGQTFVGWRDITVDWTQPNELQKWYMPGDTLEASLSTTLVAEYSVDNNDSTTTFVIDGQGGQTSQGSYYFVAFVSNFQLVEYRFPSNLFYYEGKTLTGYNTAADGSGTAYQPNDKLPESTFIQRLYAQWKDNNAGSTGGSGGGTSGGGGGGGAPATAANTISASNISNGKVSFDKSTAKKDDTVTVTVTPDAGYQLDKLTVTDAKGKAIAVTKKSDSKYTFTMPDSKVTITPTFSKIENTKPSKTGFNDVASSAWYADAVQYVTDKGLMNGTDDNQFSPNASTTRGMLMTVLTRYAGEDTTGGATWYEKGMNWAKAKGVSDGTNPNADITREQLVTMLYRYAGSPVVNGSLDSFSDAASVSSYAVNAMQWAVANGIVNGSNGKLNPQNNATRAEVAAILMRFCEMGK